MNERYLRQIQLSEVGSEGQQKLLDAKVLVIGAGGLGCPILQYLATSGVGTLGIVDHDAVSKSNLHRQILYSPKDIGQKKAIAAKQKLEELNPETKINTYPHAIDAENCLGIIKNYDIVVDGTDNFVTRYLINDACIILDKPLVFGALYKFEGQVSVFNYKNGPSYRCLFPNPPSKGEVPNCNEIGVLGVLPGIIGLLQANEVMKIILQIGEVLSGKILYLNTLNYQQRILNFSKNDKIISEIKKKNKPEIVQTDDCQITNTISLDEIKNLHKLLLIDVRELEEQPILKSENILKIPLSTFETENRLQNDDFKKIFFCMSGIRSLKATNLATEKGLLNCFSLKEGASELENWLNEKNERRKN